MSTDVRTIATTRIEKLAEALEELALGVAAKQIARGRSTDGSTPAILDQYLIDGRAALRVALREFLQPIVQLVADAQVRATETKEVANGPGANS